MVGGVDLVVAAEDVVGGVDDAAELAHEGAEGVDDPGGVVGGEVVEVLEVAAHHFDLLDQVLELRDLLQAAFGTAGSSRSASGRTG